MPKLTLSIKREKAYPSQEKNKIVELGAIISDDTKFHDKKKTVANGRERAGWICRVFNAHEKHEMLILHKALVLPLLEYCSQPISLRTDKRIRELTEEFYEACRGSSKSKLLGKAAGSETSNS